MMLDRTLDEVGLGGRVRFVKADVEGASAKA